MQKNNKKTNIIVAIVTFVLIVSFAGYIIKSNFDREEREELESVARSKERAYNDYIESIEDIVDSKNQSDQVEVAKISKEALYEMVEYEDYYKKTKDGNEYLDKLEKEATKNLNEALHSMLSSGRISKENFEEIRYFADNPIYVSKENLALYEKEEKDYNKSLAHERQEKREELGAVQTGYSESEVKLILGSPQDVIKNDEAEFWTYDGVVLTIKNGYVFDITYSLE